MNGQSSEKIDLNKQRPALPGKVLAKNVLPENASLEQLLREGKGSRKLEVKSDDEVAPIASDELNKDALTGELKKEFLVEAEPKDLGAAAAGAEIKEPSAEEQEKEFREKVDKTFLQIFTSAKKNGLMRSIFKKGEEGYEDRKERLSILEDELKKRYIDACLYNLKEHGKLEGWSLRKDILEIAKVELENNPELTRNNETFFQKMVAFCDDSLKKIKEEIENEINNIPGEGDKNSIDKKIILKQEEFNERYEKILGKDLYDNSGDLLKIISFDPETSLVTFLAHSQQMTRRINEFESDFLTKYDLPDEEKKDKKSFETIQKDIDLEVNQKKEELLAKLEREKINLGFLKTYLIHLNDMLDRLNEYLGDSASEEDKEAGRKLLKKEVNKANEEIRTRFEALNPRENKKTNSKENTKDNAGGNPEDVDEKPEGEKTPEQAGGDEGLEERKKRELEIINETANETCDFILINSDWTGFDEEDITSSIELAMRVEFKNALAETDFFAEGDIKGMSQKMATEITEGKKEIIRKIIENKK